MPVKFLKGLATYTSDFIEDKVEDAKQFVDDRVNDIEYEVNELKSGNYSRASQAIVKAVNPATRPLYDALEKVEQVEETVSRPIAEFVEDTTGLNADIAQAGIMAISPGAGEIRALKPVANKGAVRLLQSLPAEPAQALTATKNLAPGVVEGVAKDPRFARGVGKLRQQSDLDIAKKKKYMTQFANGEITNDQLKSRLAKMKKASDANYSTLATPDDPDIFEVASQKNLDPTNPSVKADQHHATTKAMTSQWVQAALQIGDDDDVVALFELHRKLVGSGMGNAKSGIIDAPGVIHDTAKASKAGRDPKQAIHSFMKKSGAGIEIPSAKVKEMIGNPKNMDELLDKYVTFAQEYLIPQKELSLKAVRKELNRHAKTLSGDEKKQFVELVNKLNMAGT